MANQSIEDQGKIDLAEYLFKRLIELGLGSVHGVPGDYNLTVLDYIKPMGLHWAGNANELNAGYAADGYGRIKGISAIITSFGVGELSAINAIGGAYAERSPVVHIVGTAPMAAQKVGACLHHTLGTGNYRAFPEMNKWVTVAQANLTDAETAPALIDATLKACVLNSQPVYIELPTNMVKAQVSVPVTPIDLSIPGYDEAYENEVVDKVVKRIQGSTKPLILMDGLTARFRVTEEVNTFVRLTGFPTLSAPFGKGIVNESLYNYYGIYVGDVGDAVIKQQVDDADLVLNFGPLHSDVNSFGFTAVPKADVTISLNMHSIKFGNEGGHDGDVISIKSFMRKLVRRVSAINLPAVRTFNQGPSSSRLLLKNLKPSADDAIIDQDSFWLRMSEFLRPGDLVLAEAGTSFAGTSTIVLPENVILINSALWLSIGYTLPALQGSALAQREQRKDGSDEGARSSGRAILFIGDGSLQMSAQGISDIIRSRLDVTIIVINNNGYTVERVIHGFHEHYNDIQPWRNTEAPNYFGAPLDDSEYPVVSVQAKNWGELRSVLRRKDVRAGKGLTMIEVFMDMADAPAPLKKLSAYVSNRNKTNGS
ncbi:hypothetical protein TrVGV298_002020 [Trichoderma virens]|nr:hypothetical protein TrVGV298_002020 [Trichoderma virens]